MQLHLILTWGSIIDTAAHRMQPEISVSIQLLGKGIPFTIKTVESCYVWNFKKNPQSREYISDLNS